MKQPYVYTMPESFLLDQEVPARWRLLTIINGFHINGKTFYGSNEWLGKKLNCSPRTVTRAVEQLEELGEIHCERTKRTRVIHRTVRQTSVSVSDRHQWGVSDRHQCLPNSDSNSDSDSSEATASQEKDDGITRIPLNEDGEPTSRGKTTKAKYPNSKEVFKLWGSAQKGGWLTNTTQRKRAQLLFDEKGVDRIKNALNFYKEHSDDEFCPLITSPSDLYQKWDNLLKHRDRINKNL